MKLCVFGGHYGSEGKGSAAEWLIPNCRNIDLQNRQPDRRLIAIGENSPNSGHTCSLGKTRNIPASSFFADEVLLGPDAAVHLAVLHMDLLAIRNATGKAPPVFIHEHAAWVCDADVVNEQKSGVVASISSTGSGSGWARTVNKQFHRFPDAVMKDRPLDRVRDDGFQVVILNRGEYLRKVQSYTYEDCIFECSQGALLDVSWGIFPFVTSRTTLPRAAIERNGLGTLLWNYAGVYRTYPIRTGGPSGPTGGQEISFADLDQPDEIATVTKRTRRIFEFSREDFELSVNLTRPNLVMFTHLDYIPMHPEILLGFRGWYREMTHGQPLGYRVDGLFLSDTIGNFVNHGAQDL